MNAEKTDLYHHHLLSMSDLSPDNIGQILKTAGVMKEISDREVKKAPVLRGKTVINCFLEPSTRTRTSFEIAAKRLSADLINVSGSASSLSKGESLKDMMNNLMAMKPDLIVMRSRFSGVPKMAADWVDCPIVNAGDGRHEHPTQTLLDLLTMQDNNKTFNGLNVSIIGDILNSRVARSNMLALRALGSTVTVCGPRTLLPVSIEKMADRVTTSIREAVEGASVVMTLRIQTERSTGAGFPNIREYSRIYGLTSAIMKTAAKDAIVMHPGPVNRGVEISSEVLDGQWSVVLNQVTNGVAVRMAVLYLLLGGGLGERGDE